MKRRKMSEYSEASCKRIKTQDVKKLTQLEAFESPVIKYLIENLHGFPFNTNSFLLDCVEKRKHNITFKRINSRYITEFDVKNMLNNNDVLIIKSPMGSGKTTLFKSLIKQNYLILSSRRSYSSFMCSELPNLVNYSDFKGSISADEHPKVIIQIQSLRRIKKIDRETTYAQWDFVYADEPNGLFKEVISSLSKHEDKKKNGDYLRRVVSQIPLVFVTDAGLAPWHVNLIQKHLLSNLSKRKIACLINEYVPMTHSIKVFDACLLRPTKYTDSFLPALKKTLGEEIGLFMDIEQFFTGKQGSAAENIFTSYVKKHFVSKGLYKDSKDIIHHLSYILKSCNQNAVVVCNTKKMALMVASYVNKLMGPKSYLLLTSETDPESKKMFMINPLDILSGKVCLIHTTMVNVGFDMNFEWCKDIFVVIDSLTSKFTPPLTDLFQAIGRNRKANVINLYVTKRRTMPSKISVESKGFIGDHLRMLLKSSHAYEDPYSNEKEAYNSVFLNPEYRLLTEVVGDEDSLESAIHTVNKAEKCLNNSPRVFSDALLYLLKCTLQKDEVVYMGGDDDHKFFNNQTDINEAVSKFQTLFQNRIAKYTTLTLDSFKDVLKQCSNKFEKKDLLKSTAEVLKLFKGSFEISYSILRMLNPELLKQWAVNYKKFQFIEPIKAVDMLNFEKETIASCVKASDLIDTVKLSLYKINKECSIKTFQDFELAVKYTDQLLDDDYDDETLNYAIEGLTRLLVDEFEINTERNIAIKKVCKAIGLVLDKNNKFILATNKTFNVDIHKMCALLLL